MKEDLQDVELLPAAMWICPTCGNDNFERIMTRECCIEDVIGSERDVDFDIPDSVTQVTSIAHPLQVACKYCHNIFNTEVAGINMFDEEDGEE